MTPEQQYLAAGVGVAVLLLVWIMVRVRRRRPRGPQLSVRQGAAYDALNAISLDLADVEDTQTLRERLLGADFGPKGVDELIAHLEANLSASDLGQAEKVMQGVRNYYLDALSDARPLELKEGLNIWFMCGVNGSGKTTTTAKLAARYTAQGHEVVVGACDTFRAAAADQLQVWGDRIGFRVVTGGERTDPASVAFNTVESAIAKNARLVILDTAGRLQVDENLMRELEKVYRVAGKAAGRDPDEALIVLDVNQGQNLRSQIDKFGSSVPLTGVVLTKYDGLGRGGAAIDSARQVGLPVRAIGTGEGENDLVDASAAWLVDKIFGQGS